MPKGAIIIKVNSAFKMRFFVNVDVEDTYVTKDGRRGEVTAATP